MPVPRIVLFDKVAFVSGENIDPISASSSFVWRAECRDFSSFVTSSSAALSLSSKSFIESSIHLLCFVMSLARFISILFDDLICSKEGRC